MFINRQEAGEQLADKLLHYRDKSPVVIALPRGGVVVGYPIARALQAPMEVIIAHKLGAPQNPEFGIGAIAEDGVTVLDQDMIRYFQLSHSTLQLLKTRETEELERRKQLYRKNTPLPLLTNKTVILVDDGLATGVTARAAIQSLKKHHPKHIIFAIPVCARETAMTIHHLVNHIVCLQTPDHLESIGRYYKDFHQVTDEEVINLLDKAKESQQVIQWGDGDFGHKIVW